MKTSIYPIARRPATFRPCRHRTDDSPASGESPNSPYLRQWIARSAARHRDLLLNIDAAKRLGLTPVGVER
jgi:hypothetical protein